MNEYEYITSDGSTGPETVTGSETELSETDESDTGSNPTEEQPAWFGSSPAIYKTGKKKKYGQKSKSKSKSKSKQKQKPGIVFVEEEKMEEQREVEEYEMDSGIVANPKTIGEVVTGKKKNADTVAILVKKAMIGNNMNISLKDVKELCGSDDYEDSEQVLDIFYVKKGTPVVFGKDLSSAIGDNPKGNKVRGQHVSNGSISPFTLEANDCHMTKIAIMHGKSKLDRRGKKKKAPMIGSNYQQKLEDYGKNVKIKLTEDPELIHLYSDFPFDIGVNASFLKPNKCWGKDKYSFIALADMVQPLTEKELGSLESSMRYKKKVKGINYPLLEELKNVEIETLFENPKTHDTVHHFSYATDIGSKLYDYTVEQNIGGMQKGFVEGKDDRYGRVNVLSDDVDYYVQDLKDHIDEHLGGYRYQTNKKWPLKLYRLGENGAEKWNKSIDNNYNPKRICKFVAGVRYKFKMVGSI
jgi:protein required for attachment to host cells